MAAVSDPASTHLPSLSQPSSSPIKCSSASAAGLSPSPSPTVNPLRPRFSSSARRNALPHPLLPPSGPHTPSPPGKEAPLLAPESVLQSLQNSPGSGMESLQSSGSPSTSGRSNLGDRTSDNVKKGSPKKQSSFDLSASSNKGNSGTLRLMTSTSAKGTSDAVSESESSLMEASSQLHPQEGAGRPGTAGGMRRMAPSPLVLPFANRSATGGSAGSAAGSQIHHRLPAATRIPADATSSVSGISWLPSSKLGNMSSATPSPLPEAPTSRGSSAGSSSLNTPQETGHTPGLFQNDGPSRLSPSSAMTSPPSQSGGPSPTSQLPSSGMRQSGSSNSLSSMGLVSGSSQQSQHSGSNPPSSASSTASSPWPVYSSPSSTHSRRGGAKNLVAAVLGLTESTSSSSFSSEDSTRGSQTAHRLPAPPLVPASSNSSTSSNSNRILSGVSGSLPSFSMALPLPPLEKPSEPPATTAAVQVPSSTSSLAARLRQRGSDGGSSGAQHALPPPPLPIGSTANMNLNMSTVLPLPKPGSIPSHATQLPTPPQGVPAPGARASPSPGSEEGWRNLPARASGGVSSVQAVRTPSPEQSPKARERLMAMAGDGGADMARACPARWSKGQELGRGSYGTVYEGLNIDDGSFFAVKEIMLEGNEGVAKELEQEVSMMSRLQHPNIVQYLGTCQRDGALYIFLELVKMGSLHSILKKYHQFPESLIRSYTRQILNGLVYLHNQNTLHRDIKCANVLVDSRGQVKLADFGMAKTLDSSMMVQSTKGSPYWMAPEVLGAIPGGYGLPADIWSLGCTVLEMAQGKPPWSNLEGFAFVFKMRNKELPAIPEELSPEARDFVVKCLSFEPHRRPTADELLRHPFVVGAGDDSTQSQPLSSTSSRIVSTSSSNSSSGSISGPQPRKSNSEGSIALADPTASSVRPNMHSMSVKPQIQGRSSPARGPGMPPLPYQAPGPSQLQQTPIQTQGMQYQPQDQGLSSTTGLSPRDSRLPQNPFPTLNQTTSQGVQPGRFPRSPGPSSPGNGPPLLVPISTPQQQQAYQLNMTQQQQQYQHMQQQQQAPQYQQQQQFYQQPKQQQQPQHLGVPQSMSFASWYPNLPPVAPSQSTVGDRRMSEPVELWATNKNQVVPDPAQYRYTEGVMQGYSMDNLPSPTHGYPEAGRAPWHVAPSAQGVPLAPLMEDSMTQWAFSTDMRQNSLEGTNPPGMGSSYAQGNRGGGPQMPRPAFPRFQSLG